MTERACTEHPRTIFVSCLGLQLENFQMGQYYTGVVSIAALENYFRRIDKLVLQGPQRWGLVMTAGDTARAEHLEKMRRNSITEVEA